MNADGASARPQRAGDDVAECRLARPEHAGNADDLARAHGQGNGAKLTGHLDVDEFEYRLAEIGSASSTVSGPIPLDLVDTYGQFAMLHLNQDGVLDSMSAA